MGVSFKVAKTGTRYRRKLLPVEANGNDGNDSVSGSQQRDSKVYSTGMGAKVADPSSVLVSSQPHSVSDDLEASFSLKLFHNGFSVGKVTELLNDIPVHLHPYDRSSEKLFSAIECGWLPGDIFDGLPCKYVNGAILCEIRDYRGCLMQGRATDSAKRNPTVHKVLLRMRMENVIKDIVSISNDSWTYGDFLEVESRVLKALQPDLHLNPQPLQDVYSAEPISKKVDLGIMWSWKKQKLSDASDTALDFRNSYHLSGTQSGSCLSGQSNRARGVTFLEHNASTSAAATQETNVVLDKSLSNPLTSKPIPYIAESCSWSALKVKTKSNLLSLPKPSCNDSNNDFSKPSSLVLDKRVRCGIQAVQGPLLKKPKLEPVDSSYQQITGSQTENSLQPFSQWKNKLLHGQIDDGKVPHDRFQQKVRPSLVVNNVPTRRSEGISELQAGMATPNVKLEPDTYNYPGSNVLQSQKQQSKQKTNLCPKRLRKKTAGSSSSLSYANAANANHVSKNLALSQPLEDSELKLVLSRFLKIQATTERYGLNNRKCELDPILQKKPSFCATPLVSYHLLASKENGKWENNSTDKNCITECSMNWGLGVCRTRTLTFSRQSHICQENETPRDVREAQITLVISEKRDEALVEARVLYGTGKERFSIDYPLMPSFTSTSSANLLATQFARVMKHEGYYLSSFQVEPKPLNAVGGLSTPPARTTELPSSTLTPGLSRSRLIPMQLQSQNIFSGGRWFQSDNVQSAVQIPNNLISKLPLTVPTQANYLMPQVQQILNRRASLQYQILQRQNQLNESVQRSLELGGLGASAGGGVQGHGSSGLGSFANVIGMQSSNPPMSLGGQMPWVGNVHVGQLNDSKLLGPTSEHSAGVWSRMRGAEGRGTRALMSGGQIPRNPIHGVPVGVSNIPADMARNLSNQQQLLRRRMHQMEMRSPVQQEMASLLQHSGGASSLQHVAGSPQTQSHQAASFHQQLDQQPQVSQPATEPKPESLQQVKEMVGYGSPEMSSQQTYGSVPVGSSKT